MQYNPRPKKLISLPREACLLYKGKYLATLRMIASLTGIHYVTICNHTQSGKVNHISIAGDKFWEVESWESYKNSLKSSGRKKRI